MNVEDLRGYEKLWLANHSMEQRVRAMKDAEVCCAPGLPDGPLCDPMEQVDERLDWCAAHGAEYRRNRAAMARVHQAIDRMEDPLERELLRLRYTDFRFGQHMSWKQVVQILYGPMGVSNSTVYRMHNSALAHFSAVPPLPSGKNDPAQGGAAPASALLPA